MDGERRPAATRPDLPQGEKSRLAYYREALAAAMVLAATAVRLAFLTGLGTEFPFLLFYPAVILAALYGGRRAGLLATVLSAVTADYFWIKPAYRFAIAQPADGLALVVFLLTGAMVAWVSETLYRARARAAAAETQALLATQRQAAAEALREAEHEKSLILDNVNEVIAFHDADNNLIWANQAYLKATDLPLSELKGRKCYHCWGLDRLCNNCPVITAIRTGEPQEAELTPENQAHWPAQQGSWHVRAAAVRDHAGKIIGAIEVAHDITVRKRAEEALRQSEQQYCGVVENTSAIVLRIDPLGVIKFANRRALEFFGYSADELIGKHAVGTIVPPQETSGRDLATMVDAIAANPDHFHSNANENICKDGRRVWLEWTNSGIYDDEGKLKEFLSVGIDATERKAAQEALRESERRYSALFGNKINGMAHCQVITDEQGRPVDYRILQINDAYERIIGIKKVDIEGHRVTEVFPAIRHYAFDYIGVYGKIALEGGEIQFEEYFEATGQYLSIYAYCPQRGEFTAIFTDITDRKRVENALRVRERLLQDVIDSSTSPIFLKDRAGKFITINASLERMLGKSREEVIGKTDYDIAPTEVADYWRAHDQQVMATGKSLQIEEVADLQDGHHVFLANKFPLVDADGRTYGVGAISHDITERKKTEAALKAAKEAADAANLAKSQFLANMSHELRTPMNAILGMTDVALPRATDPTVQDCLKTVKGSADLLLTLLNDLLDSAKIESGKLELESAPFSLRRMLDQMTRVLAVRASEKGLAFSCRLPDDTPDALVGDRMRLQQVLLNLGGNAIKFTERGEVEIGLRALLQNGEACLEFAVRDSGIGIPPTGLERLFQPFGQADASMSRRFGGTGLGLSISKNLVEKMGGRIWAESEVGKGSTFYFTVRLPLAHELPADFEAPLALPTAACQPLRFLLVEDNPANQKLATYILQERGHVVEVAGDGQEAIGLAEQNHYDVILMDVQMPGMDGLEATMAIRKREGGSSRVPIIAMTAHAMKGDRDRCLAAGMDGYLSKPVNAREMLGLVESLAGGGMPVVEAAVPMPKQATALAFNADEALTRCFHSADMVREMIQCFYDELENLFPQMRSALGKGDLIEVGQLGHHMKGTVVYLGARPAEEAALRVERFCQPNCGTASEAEEAIHALEHECIALKAALVQHPLVAEPARDDSP